MLKWLKGERVDAERRRVDVVKALAEPEQSAEFKPPLHKVTGTCGECRQPLAIATGPKNKGQWRCVCTNAACRQHLLGFELRVHWQWPNGK